MELGTVFFTAGQRDKLRVWGLTWDWDIWDWENNTNWRLEYSRDRRPRICENGNKEMYCGHTD